MPAPTPAPALLGPAAGTAAVSAIDDDLKKLVISRLQRRISVGVAFVDNHDAAPREEWGGEDGVIQAIMREKDIPKGSRKTVVDTLEEVSRCVQNGKKWTPEKKPVQRRPTSQLIKEGSPEQELVANCMEAGYGLIQTTALVNEGRSKKGESHVGMSAIRTAHHRMAPTVTAILDAQQGSDNDSVRTALFSFRAHCLAFLYLPNQMAETQAANPVIIFLIFFADISSSSK